MRVLYSHYLTDEHHPAVQMVHHISHHLRGLGHVVSVHASAGIQPVTLGTADVHSKAGSPNSLTSKLKQKVWFAKAMSRNRKWIVGDRKAFAEFNPDLVITRQDAYSWSVMKAALESKVPCITYADAPVAYESRHFDSAGRWHPHGLVERIEKWGLKHSKAIITVSNPASRRLKRYGLNVPIYVNPNGVVAEKYEGIDSHIRHAIREKLGINTELVIGFQGTFKAFHGMERLRELILSTQDRDNVTWVLIGDGPERSELEEAVRECKNILFLGRRHPDDMNRLLSVMDIAVAPHSQMDGDFYFCPLKILEYAASGCATIASHQGDIPLLLNDGNGGIIVNDDDLESWTSALSRLIDNDAHRKSIAENGRQFVLENLTWQRTAERVDDVLHLVMSENKSILPNRQTCG